MFTVKWTKDGTHVSLHKPFVKKAKEVQHVLETLGGLAFGAADAAECLGSFLETYVDDQENAKESDNSKAITEKEQAPAGPEGG